MGTPTICIVIVLYNFITAADESWYHRLLTTLSVIINWVKCFSLFVHLRTGTKPVPQTSRSFLESAQLDKVQTRSNARYKHCNLLHISSVTDKHEEELQEISFCSYIVLS